jgi:hypothetical protein
MADAADRHLKIMNNMLARIGAGAIMSADEDSDLAEQVAAVYYDRLNAVLAMHEWSFAGQTYKLDELAKTVENDYDVVALKFNNGWRGAPRKVLTDPRCPRDPLREFLIEAGVLYAMRCPIWAVVTVQPDPAVWDPMFTLGFTALGASDLCVPVTHDDGLAKSLRLMAEGTPEEQGRGGLIGRAMASDAAKSRTVSPQWSDPLTRAHME